MIEESTTANEPQVAGCSVDSVEALVRVIAQSYMRCTEKRRGAMGRQY